MSWSLSRILEDLQNKLTEGKHVVPDVNGVKHVFFKREWRLWTYDSDPWIEYIPAEV